MKMNLTEESSETGSLTGAEMLVKEEPEYEQNCRDLQGADIFIKEEPEYEQNCSEVQGSEQDTNYELNISYPPGGFKQEDPLDIPWANQDTRKPYSSVWKGTKDDTNLILLHHRLDCFHCGYMTRHRKTMRKHILFKHFRKQSLEKFNFKLSGNSKYAPQNHLNREHSYTQRSTCSPDKTGSILASEDLGNLCDSSSEIMSLDKPPDSYPHCDMKKDVKEKHALHSPKHDRSSSHSDSLPNLTTKGTNVPRPLIRRSAKHSQERRFSCSNCEYRSKNEYALKMHRFVKHVNIRPLSCPYCDYKAAMSSNMKVHITAKHTNERPLSCPHCKHETRYPYNLKKHILVKHTNERPFSCPHCDHKTSNAYLLKNHIIAKHTNERPFPCSQCEYKAIKPSELRDHIASKHTKERPLSCPHCEYRALKNCHLKVHIMAKHTNNRPHSCPDCEFKTSYTSTLKTHILLKHSNKELSSSPDELRNSYNSPVEGHIVDTK